MSDAGNSGSDRDGEIETGAGRARGDVVARVKFRPLARGDVEAVRALLWRVWMQAYAPILGVDGVERHCATLHTKRRLNAIARNHDANCTLVAEYDGEIIAFASAVLQWHGAVDIYEVYVDRPYQGLGLGTRLIEAAFYRFPGARTWRIEVLARNTQAVALYERMGFCRTGSRPDWYQSEIEVLQLARGNSAGNRYGAVALVAIHLRGLAQRIRAVVSR